MTRSIITTERDLLALCKDLEQAPAIAFDTEFVSEHSYRPQLCLVQIATDDRVVAVDPIAVRGVAPLWEVIVEGNHETVVHAGREELCFALDARGKRPNRLIDVQVAAGFVGVEYPAGYSTLTNKILGFQTGKGETRTDWRKRPLSPQQLNYALDDVRHLLSLRDELYRRLEQLHRRDWLREEMLLWQSDIEHSRSRERWRNISGGGSLHGRAVTVLKELWLWRESQAELRNTPPRKILRDDLLVELAKRQTTDVRQICALRGMERQAIREAAQELVDCVKRGLAAKEEPRVKTPRMNHPPQATMLGQFLSSALSSICHDAQIAPSLVGNPTDVRDLIAYRLAGGEKSGLPAPRLAVGWRAAFVGDVLVDLLAGKLTVRIRDPRSEQPLAFEPRDGQATPEPKHVIDPSAPLGDE